MSSFTPTFLVSRVVCSCTGKMKAVELPEVVFSWTYKWLHSWGSRFLSEVPCSFCLIKMSVLAIAQNFGRENFYPFTGTRSIPCPHSPLLNSVHWYFRALIGSIQFLSLHAAKRKYKAWQICVCMLSRKGTSQKWLSFCCQICMYFVL